MALTFTFVKPCVICRTVFDRAVCNWPRPDNDCPDRPPGYGWLPRVGRRAQAPDICDECWSNKFSVWLRKKLAAIRKEQHEHTRGEAGLVYVERRLLLIEPLYERFNTWMFLQWIADELGEYASIERGYETEKIRHRHRLDKKVRGGG